MKVQGAFYLKITYIRVVALYLRPFLVRSHSSAAL